MLASLPSIQDPLPKGRNILYPCEYIDYVNAMAMCRKGLKDDMDKYRDPFTGTREKAHVSPASA